MKRNLFIICFMFLVFNFCSVFADDNQSVIINNDNIKNSANKPATIDKKATQEEINKAKDNSKIRLDLDRIEKNMKLDFSTNQINAMLP